MRWWFGWAGGALALVSAGCVNDGFLPVLDRDGAPESAPAGRPTAMGAPVRIAEIESLRTWTGGRTPKGAEGTRVEAFARGLQRPSLLYVLPNGDVLVAESDPDESAKSRLRLLRDSDTDGVADRQSILLRGLDRPRGLALTPQALWVSTAAGVRKFPYRDGQARIVTKGQTMAQFPSVFAEWSGDLAADRDGRLYIALAGDTPDRSEYGQVQHIGAETDGAEPVTLPGAPVGLAWELERDTLWALLASDAGEPLRLVAVTGSEIEPGEPRQAVEIAGVRAAAPSDLINGFGNTLPGRFAHGMFVGQHGAGTGTQLPEDGYAVLFVPFRDAHPEGEAQVVLSGFIDDDGNILGRPVAVAVDSQGALLVADDVGNAIWRVTSAPSPAAAEAR